jgi:RNA polymerase sigma-70 factor, ECF subfamily
MVSVEPDRLLVCEALAQLSDADRGVLSRSYYHGWTTAQIAHDLHIPEGTVKMRLHQAVRALQRRLQEMGFRTRQPSSRIGP